MAAPRRRRQLGQGMVEFSLVAPLLLVVIIGLIDFARAVEANTTVAEAARQGARQAIANALASDTPFGTYNNQPCSGQVFTTNQTGTGCLTDAAIIATVKGVLKDITNSVTTYSSTTAQSCPAPAAGAATICVAPAESGGTAPSYSSCAAATSSLGNQPQPGDLGSRQVEWAATTFSGCFLVQVTVRFAYQPITPLLSTVIGSRLQLVSSSSTLAEY